MIFVVICANFNFIFYLSKILLLSIYFFFCFNYFCINFIAETKITRHLVILQSKLSKLAKFCRSIFFFFKLVLSLSFFFLFVSLYTQPLTITIRRFQQFNECLPTVVTHQNSAYWMFAEKGCFLSLRSSRDSIISAVTNKPNTDDKRCDKTIYCTT